jgi:ribonuclease HII
MVHAPTIDRIGITRAVALATARALRSLTKDRPARTIGQTYGIGRIDIGQTYVKLDGLLRAPQEFTHQATIIRGDQTEKEIGLASILAKVTRDRFMARIAASPQFAPYEFHLHKGYGTATHRAALRRHGLSAMHRRSFCKGLIKSARSVS